MKKLCDRVAELLREHPILWLPYIAADILAICLWRLRGLAEKGIFHWFTTITVHSVLGGDIALPRRDSATLARASIAYAPIGFATIIAVVCLFVASLLVTAAMVDSIEREQRLDAREILARIAVRWRRILLFALRFLITVGVFIAGITLLSYYLLFLVHRQELITSFWLVAGLMLIGVGCTAWLVIPAAMRLLRGETASVSAQIRNQGTILAILAAETGLGIGFLIQKLEVSIMLNSRWEITALSVFNSVIANAPDALLFIALALLAAELSRESDSNEGSKICELLPLLMPLHYDKSKEPQEFEG
jgi:hypothetical protein